MPALPGVTMDWYDAKEAADNISRQAGMVTFCLLAVVFISLERGVPEWYVWLALALMAILTHSLVDMAMTTAMLKRYGHPRAVSVEATVEPEPEPVAQVAQTPSAPATPQWINTVDWGGLAEYVADPDAVLSRDAVAAWVDQRAYSPRNGDTSKPFPQVMVEVGAARAIAVNGTTRYQWTPNAPRVVERMARSFGNSPRPTNGGDGAVN